VGNTIPVDAGERLRQLALATDASRKQWDDDRAARDAYMVELDRDNGVSLDYLSRWSGLTDSQCQRILAREASRAGG
jgi:hypothetical protein